MFWTLVQLGLILLIIWGSVLLVIAIITFVVDIVCSFFDRVLQWRSGQVFLGLIALWVVVWAAVTAIYAKPIWEWWR
jgi:hypothetical protein